MLSARTTSMNLALSAKQTRSLMLVKIVQQLGESVITLSTSIAFQDGSRLVAFVLLIIKNGISKGMVNHDFN